MYYIFNSRIWVWKLLIHPQLIHNCTITSTKHPQQNKLEESKLRSNQTKSVPIRLGTQWVNGARQALATRKMSSGLGIQQSNSRQIYYGWRAPHGNAIDVNCFLCLFYINWEDQERQDLLPGGRGAVLQQARVELEVGFIQGFDIPYAQPGGSRDGILCQPLNMGTIYQIYSFDCQFQIPGLVGLL